MPSSVAKQEVYMKEQEKIKTILVIALMYTAITSAFSFLHKINTLLIGSHEVINMRMHLFLKRNILWITVMTVIIIALTIYIKKSNKKVSTLIDENPMIGIAVGILIVLNGISDLASSLPLSIISIESVFETIRHTDVFLDVPKESMIRQTVLTNAFSILLVLSKIVLGIYLVKVYKKRVK